MLEQAWAYPIIFIIAGSHFAIDWLRNRIEKKHKDKTQIFWIFIADQALCLLVILITAALFDVNVYGNRIYDLLSQHGMFGAVVLHLFLFVFVLAPAAVFIKKLLGLLSNEPEKSKAN